jgi:hypothetical protein
MLAEDCVGENPREMIVTRQANNVGTRQFARLGGDVITSSKTSVGETNMLKSFSRIEVGDAEGARGSDVAGMI